MNPSLPAKALLPAMFLALGSTLFSDTPSIRISVDPASGRTPISPYIYGTNQDLPGVVPGARRQGGNRTTGYNWENNASNAGKDWKHSSDDEMTASQDIPRAQADVPAIALTHFQDRSIAEGVPYTILTLPMAGFVAADKSGPVGPGESAPSARWDRVQFSKPGPFTYPPDLTDGVVYVDELLNLLVTRYGKASGPTGVKAYDLDNETELWSDTHPRIHPKQPTCAEIIAKSVELARVVKRIDSSAEVLGPVSWGATAYVSYQEAPDWPAVQSGGRYGWFLDYYLDRMRKASEAAGIRLLDVLDLHRYSDHEAGGESVVNTTNYSNIACNEGRLQAPRALWDPAFHEESWVSRTFPDCFPYIPRFQASIHAFYPGTKLGFTEYNYGGETDVTGGLAEADVLGIYGKYGVYLANFWQLHTDEDPSYVAAAFRLYRNYDGAGGRFGDTEVASTTSDTVYSSVYASLGAGSAALHVVAINKNYTRPMEVTVNLAGAVRYGSARVFAFDSKSAAITERAGIPRIEGNTFTYTLPPLTAAHFVLLPAAGG
jgi:hypothetical protein